MGKQRSRGVTIFGWVFIIFSLFGLLNFAKGPFGSTGRICPLPTSGAMTGSSWFAPLWTTVNFVMMSASLIAGIFILKLKEWARKLVILVRVVSIVIGLWTTIPAVNMVQSEAFKTSMEKAIETKKEQIQERYKPEYKEQVLKEQEKTLEMGSKFMPTVIFSIFSLWFGWNALIIFYFTRLKVKEQFTV